MTAVTTVTNGAEAADELKPSDYRDIYTEVRGYDAATGEYRISLRAFVGLIADRLPGRETLSIGYWSKYHHDQIQLTRRARNELRALVGLPALPPTVAEVTATIDPDATVYQVGAQPATRVIMVGPDAPAALTLRLNGRLTILPDAADAARGPAPEAAVTSVTTPQRATRPTRAIRISPTRFDHLQRLRAASGLTWDEFAARLAVLYEESQVTGGHVTGGHVTGGNP